MICWFCIIASVLISWLLHPQQSRKNTVTSDLIAVVTFPIVAAAHFLHQNLTYNFNGDPRPLTSWYPEAVIFGASVEAPLTICEDFVVVGIYLFCRASSQRQWKRATITLVPTLVCIAVEVFQMARYPSGYVDMEQVNFYRDYNSNHRWAAISTLLLAAMAILMGVGVLMVAGISVSGARRRTLDPETRSLGQRARTSSQWMSKLFWVTELTGSMTALVLAAVGIVVKYYICPSANMSSLWSVKFMPRTMVSIDELDQVVAILGGVTTLSFSLCGALASRWKRVTPIEIRSTAQ